MRYVEMFGGIGATTQAIKELKLEQDFELVRYYEILPQAVKIFNYNHGTSYEASDVTKVKTFPKHDLLVAGFPCQSFSIAGLRGGLKDERGQLFYEISRCLWQRRPKTFILENVRGILNHDKGRTFRTILNTLHAIGYDVEWQVITARNVGSPQLRARVFIIGHFRNQPYKRIIPIKFNTLYKEKNGINFTITTRPTRRGECVLLETTKGYRWLTPIECERLQGFPTNYTKVDGVSETKRYHVIGNSMHVGVMKRIIGEINNG